MLRFPETPLQRTRGSVICPMWCLLDHKARHPCGFACRMCSWNCLMQECNFEVWETQHFACVFAWKTRFQTHPKFSEACGAWGKKGIQRGRATWGAPICKKMLLNIHKLTVLSSSDTRRLFPLGGFFRASWAAPRSGEWRFNLLLCTAQKNSLDTSFSQQQWARLPIWATINWCFPPSHRSNVNAWLPVLQHWLTYLNIASSSVSMLCSGFIVLSMVFLAIKSNRDPDGVARHMLPSLHH